MLDLGNASLIGVPGPLRMPRPAPDTFAGTAIVVRNAKDVVIRGGHIHAYKVAIRAENAPGLRIENVDASGNYRQRLKSTPAREDASDWLWPHHNDENEWT